MRDDTVSMGDMLSHAREAVALLGDNKKSSFRNDRVRCPPESRLEGVRCSRAGAMGFCAASLLVAQVHDVALLRSTVFGPPACVAVANLGDVSETDVQVTFSVWRTTDYRLLYETFDSSGIPAGWTVFEASGTPSTRWEPPEDSGTYGYVRSYGNGLCDAVLATPPVGLMPDSRISFAASVSSSPSAGTHLRLLASTTPITPATVGDAAVLAELCASESCDSSARLDSHIRWYTYGLADYGNDVVYLALAHVDDSWASVYLHEVRVGPAATEETLLADTQYVPLLNPGDTIEVCSQPWDYTPQAAWMLLWGARTTVPDDVFPQNNPSLVTALTVIPADHTPTQVRPAHLDTVGTDSVAIVWSKVDTAPTWYWLQYATDSGMSTFLVDTVVTDTAFVLSSLEPGTTYWWRVRAFAYDYQRNWSTWSPTSAFVTEAPVSTRVAPAPRIGVTVRHGATADALCVRLGKPAAVRVCVYGLRGSRMAVVAQGPMPAGFHQVGLPEDFPAGCYLLRVDIDGVPAYKRLSLVR